MEQIATFSNLQALFIVWGNLKLREHFTFFFFFPISVSIWKLLGFYSWVERGNLTFLEDFFYTYYI